MLFLQFSTACVFWTVTSFHKPSDFCEKNKKEEFEVEFHHYFDIFVNSLRPLRQE